MELQIHFIGGKQNIIVVDKIYSKENSKNIKIAMDLSMSYFKTFFAYLLYENIGRTSNKLETQFQKTLKG